MFIANSFSLDQFSYGERAAEYPRVVESGIVNRVGGIEKIFAIGTVDQFFASYASGCTMRAVIDSKTVNQPSNDEPSSSLVAALEAHDIELPDEQARRLTEFCRALWDWNRKINLTRHDNFDLFVTRDLTDSLQLSAVLNEGERVLDVGTGGGVPGLVLSILRPDLDVAVCDSVAKKAKVVADIAARLELPVQVAHGRAEEVLEIASFDSLTARAVGPITKLLRWFEPHWGSIGRLLLIKGPRWLEERGEARHLGLLKAMELRKLTSYAMPGGDSESVILSITPSSRQKPSP